MMAAVSPMVAVPDDDTPLGHGFLLIDPANVEDADVFETVERHACVPDDLSHQADLMPQLIDLADVDPATRAKMIAAWHDEWTGPPIVCGWIDSDAKADALAQHIARFLVGPGRADKPVLWRYYDPRVLSLSLAVLSPFQRQALLGPVQSWRFPWAGHYWAVSGPGVATDIKHAHSPAWPSREQWRRIEFSHVADRVVNRLPPELTVGSIARLPTQCDRIFCHAIGAGWPSHSDDLVDYTWHCLRYGNAFEQHPELVAAQAALAQEAVYWPQIKSRILADRAMRFHFYPSLILPLEE